MTSGWPGLCLLGYAMLCWDERDQAACIARHGWIAVQLRARSTVEDSVTGDRTNVASLKEERPVQSNPIAVRVRVRVLVLVRAAKHACDAGRGPLCGWILLHCCRSLSRPISTSTNYLARYCLGACFILSPEHEIHMLPN